MIGKHLAASIQKTGDLFGETGRALAITDYEAEQKEKQRIAEQEALDRKLEAAYEKQKLVEGGKQQRHEENLEFKGAAEEGRQQRHEESLAAAKERTLATIKDRQSRHKETLAAKDGDSLKTKDKLVRLQADINSRRELLGSTGAIRMKPEEKKGIEAEIQRLENEKQSIWNDALEEEGNSQRPESKKQFRWDRISREEESRPGGSSGIVGGQMGASTPGGGGAPSPSSNAVPTVNSKAERDALAPGTLYLAPDGSPHVKK